MTPIQMQNKKILLVGLVLTGLSVARYLNLHGLSFDVVDESAPWLGESAAQWAAKTTELSSCEKYAQLNAGLCVEYDVIVLSPGVPRAHVAIAAAIEAGVQVFGDIELFACIVDKPVIAVTGSNGKSTVVSWLTCVLEHAGMAAVLCGNIGKPALDALSPSASIYVLELSSYQLESTFSLSPFAAVVLNISDDHMDRYASIEHYAQVKHHVYQNCQHRVFNQDDALAQPSTSDLDALQTPAGVNQSVSNIMFSLDAQSGAHYSLQTAANEAFLCRGNERLLAVEKLQPPGLHNVANALAVLALAHALSISDQHLQEGLARFNGLVHRTQLIRKRRGVRWYNDSKGTNIDACKKAIEAMNGPVVLIAGGLGKGADFNALRETAQRQLKALVLIGKDANLIADALSDCVAVVHFAQSLADAVSVCAAVSEPGDVVLLSPACASFDMFENFEVRGEQFAHEVAELVA